MICHRLSSISFAIEQVVVFVGQRTVQARRFLYAMAGQHIPPPAPARRRLGTGRTPAGACRNLAFKDPQHRYANFPGADHPGGFAVHGEAGEAFEGEIGIAGTLVSAVDAAVERSSVEKSAMLNRFGEVSWNARRCRRKLLRLTVDVVKPGAAQGDIFHPVGLQLFQHRAAAVVIDEDTYRFATVGGFGVFAVSRKSKNSSSKPYASLTCCRYFLSYCFVL